jgi:hypothetical protein
VIAFLSSNGTVPALMRSWSEPAGTMGRIRGRVGRPVRRTRLLAMSAAFLFLLVQLTVAAHTHPSALAGQSGACAQLTVDSGLCPLCLLAFHLPVSPASSLAVALPTVDTRPALTSSAQGFPSLVRTSCPTRAPPRAV